MADDPYAHAPRLPDAPVIDPRRLFHGPVSGTVDAHAGHADGDAPVELEIGPGRGWFTVERLDHDPSVRVIGLEIRRKWATIVDDRLKARGYGQRGRVFAEDATQVIPKFQPATISVAYLHFPDPWWKKRHQKRLVMGDGLLGPLSRALVPGGQLLIQTDVAMRGDEYEALVSSCPAFEPVHATARIEDHTFVARSPRERKAIEDGLPIVRLLYRCRGPLPAV